MNNELSKTISTCAIWMSVACILTFGIFQRNINGDAAIFLVCFCLPGGIILGAVAATKIIWSSSPVEKPQAAPTPFTIKGQER